jgi:mannose-6-phosphate isomerase-like protein (cupin superfamily)
MKHLVSGEGTITEKAYGRLQNISIDYAIMEVTTKGVVLPSDFGWSDIGTWKSLYDFLPKDDHNNVIEGDVFTKDTENCLVLGYERLIATNRLNRTVVVETPDAVFVSDMDYSRDAKSFPALLKDQGRREYLRHQTEYHSWGSYTLLDVKEDHKVARMMIHPGSAYEPSNILMTLHLSVIKGQAKVTAGTRSQVLTQGESMVISGTDAVTFENPGTGPLHLIQVEMDG